MSKTKAEGRSVKPGALPDGHEALVADALHDAMLAGDAPRCVEIGKIAAELARIEAERGRRKADGR